MNIKNAIELNSVEKKYDGFELADISFKLPSGCVLGLVGENGAGKSTTINIIMNAVGGFGGSVKVLGVDNRHSEFINTKQHIGVVTDSNGFFDIFTIKHVQMIMKNVYTGWDGKRFKELVRRFNLPTDKKISEFSRGMKMKLSIAIAMSHGAKLLVLDEATSGLDPMVREDVLNLFNEFTREESNSILLSSHIVSDLEKICDYIVFIHKGQLVLFEEKDRIKEQYAIVKLRREQLGDVPKHAIVKKVEGEFGVQLLVLQDKISPAFQRELSTLEDIIVFLSKEG